MPSTQAIRRRIRSARNVAQITRALQLVASSRVRRAQESVAAARPYAEQLLKLLSRVASAAEDLEDPLLATREVKRALIVLVTPDRGLAGALNSNTTRRAAQLAQELRQQYGADLDVSFLAVGRKGRDFLNRNHQSIIAEFTQLGDHPRPADVRAIARTITDAYIGEQVDLALLVYPKFASLVSQVPTVTQLLPVEPPEEVEETQGPSPEYIFEPDIESIFSELLPRYVETQIYQPLLETVASFYSAQMVAMKNATDSANDLLADLTLTYNKIRQSSITTQILEIVSGAEALK